MFVSFINVFTRGRKAEADPVSKLRAGEFSNICWSSHNGFATCKRDEVYFITLNQKYQINCIRKIK